MPSLPEQQFPRRSSTSSSWDDKVLYCPGGSSPILRVLLYNAMRRWSATNGEFIAAIIISLLRTGTKRTAWNVARDIVVEGGELLNLLPGGGSEIVPFLIVQSLDITKRQTPTLNHHPIHCDQ